MAAAQSSPSSMRASDGKRHRLCFEPDRRNELKLHRQKGIQMNKHAPIVVSLFAGIAMALAASPAAAQDKVKVGVFPVSSSLPYFVALEKGYFKEQNIEPE